MKKRLLFCCALMVATLSSYAYQLGDYVFTVDAKYKVVGDNLLTNGDFSSIFEGWKDASGSELNPTFWSIETGASETGGNVVQSSDGSADQTGNYMFQSVPYESGKTYIISFKVKGVDPLTSSITFGTSNYLDVYVNTDGSLTKEGDGFVQIATTNGVTGDWTSYSYSFTDKVEGGSNGYIVVGFGQLTPGTQVSDVEIREVSQVFDTRISDKEFAYAESLLNIDGFVNGREDFEGIIAVMRQLVESGEVEEISAGEDAMNNFLDAQTAFLNANSYDVTPLIDSKTLWTTQQRKADGTYGDWYVEGSGRWFHNSSSDPYILDQIQGSYNLPAGTAKIVKALPPGKYFFSCESKGYRMAGTGSAVRYTPDYNYVVEGAAVFIGNDSVYFNLDQRNFDRHFVVSDVAEGETLNAGFWHPATSVDNKLGGEVYMQAPVLRIIGDNSDGQMESYIVNYATLKNIATQANALRVMLDSAITVKAKAEFPWGKDALQESITYYEGTYSSLSVIQPADELFAEAADSLMQSMRLVRSAIQAYYSLNEPYTQLCEQVAVSQGEFDSPDNANAQASARQALKAGLDKANALISNVTSEPQADEFNAAISELKELTYTFKLAVASFKNSMEIELVNANFTSYSGGNTSAFSATGWDVINASGNGKFQYGSGDENFEYGERVTSWRGSTGNAMNKISQSVTLKNKGAYEFSCQVYANNEDGTRDGNMTNDIKSGIFAYAKLAESADSIGAVDARTPYTYQATLGYGALVPKWVVITYNKVTDGDEVIEIGLDALNLHNGYSNRYGFGSPRINYCGPHDSYITDVKAALEAQINKLEGLWNSASDDLKASEEGVAMQEAIENAKLVLAGTIEQVPGVGNSSVAEDAVAGAQSQLYRNLKRVIAEFEPVVTGIGGVKTDAPVKVQNGVFSISGVKVAQSAENLPKGLYIVDGKKVIVK